MVDNSAPDQGSGFEGLTAEQLKLELAKAEDELEDLNEVRRFTLGQTGVHIGASRLRSLQSTWTRDEAGLRERIETLRALLASRASIG